MASVSAGGAKPDKPSFAKIAAAGLKPPSLHQNHSNNSGTNAKYSITSAPRDGANVLTPSAGSTPAFNAAQPKKLVHTSTVKPKEPDTKGTPGPEVLVHSVESAAQVAAEPVVTDGLLAPAVEDSNSQLSNDSSSAKPPSLDGKSVASGTTFAMDEKESLRPDDSASVKAIEDEDVFSPPSVGLPDSRPGSEEGTRAFRDQLREISSMEPPQRGFTPQAFVPAPHPHPGVLYVPPQGPGIGMVPIPGQIARGISSAVDFPPDPKLLEALESARDRIWVLKLENDMRDFVKAPDEKTWNLPSCNAYYRMLAHKIADYFMLGHAVDDSASAVRIEKTDYCRIPPLLSGIATPSTAASTPPPIAPTMKILRRGMDSGPAIANGSNLPSKSTSENGESEEDKKKLPASREEREARYEAARLRIMGSAKPAESTEEPKAKDDSRSSSAAGKKSKQQRPDSDDGFEARSAYNAYFTPGYGSSGYNTPAYASSAFAKPPDSSTHMHRGYSNHGPPSSFQEYAVPNMNSAPWTYQSFDPTHQTQRWPQGPQPSYNMSTNFQQAMSLHSPLQSPQQPNLPSAYGQSYQQPFYGQHPAWPQQQDYQISSNSMQGGLAMPSGFQSRSSPSFAQVQAAQAAQDYAYGQLPSQTFPGRPPSKLEHPLPGSYKSKHFNPQSQAFVPGQPNTLPFRTITPQGTTTSPTFGSPYNMPSSIQRQPSVQSQASTYSSPHTASMAIPQPYVHAQPMVHPLPQPVFPQQPSPSLPLPAKPSTTPQKPASAQQATASPAQSNGVSGQGRSSIAKWGTPASLPAKPPPPAEPFDPAKFPQIQRQPTFSAAAAARVPSGGVPTFASTPPIVGSMAVNGSGGQASKRV